MESMSLLNKVSEHFSNLRSSKKVITELDLESAKMINGN